MKKILIVGGSGFVGRYLIEELSKSANNEIYVADIKSDIRNVKNINFIEWDIRNPIETDIPNVDIIVHLAALCKEPGYDWDEYFITNYIGTKNILKLAERIKCTRIIFTSTMMVFKAEDLAKYETDCPNPDTAYGISKAMAEEAIIGWANANNNEYVIIRPGVIYGPGEDGNFLRMIREISKNRFAYIGKRSTVKGVIYIKECANILAQIVERPKRNRIYHFVTDEILSISNICDTISDVFQYKKVRLLIPLKIAILIGYFAEWINSLGLKNPIHHRRIEKLYYSTDIRDTLLSADGYTKVWTFKKSMQDYRKHLEERS